MPSALITTVPCPAEAVVTVSVSPSTSLVGLALLLAVVWAGLGAVRRELTVRLGLVEWAVVGLVAWWRAERQARGDERPREPEQVSA